MSRLRHDIKAYLAALRMTQTQLVVFVEGKENDPTFYSTVIERYQVATQTIVELRRALELPGSAKSRTGGSGGKLQLQKAGKLWASQTARAPHSYKCKIIFALDKDIDDIQGTKNPDNIYVYTEGYSVENYLVRGTDLVRAASSAYSLTPNELERIFNPDQQSWMAAAHLLWGDWIVFCIASKEYSKAGVGNFRIPSKFNSPAHAPCKEDVKRTWTTLLAAKSKAYVPDFEFVIDAISLHVKSELATRRGDRFFKGDWYIDILYSQVEADPHLRSLRADVGKVGLWAAIRASFQLANDMYDHYRRAFDGILA